jgi:hypothetical protein
MTPNGYGGSLPVSEWAKADKAIVQAWALVARLEADTGAAPSHVIGAVGTMKNEIKALSVLLERFKHGPALSEWNLFTNWEGRINDLPRWANELSGVADFASGWGMIKFVAKESAKDAAKIAQDTGNAVIGAVKVAPWMILAVVVILIGIKLSRE